MANLPCLKQKHKDNQLKGLLWWHVLRSVVKQTHHYYDHTTTQSFLFSLFQVV